MNFDAASHGSGNLGSFNQNLVLTRSRTGSISGQEQLITFHRDKKLSSRRYFFVATPIFGVRTFIIFPVFQKATHTNLLSRKNIT